jgi:hypothetical protein
MRIGMSTAMKIDMRGDETLHRGLLVIMDGGPLPWTAVCTKKALYKWPELLSLIWI